MMATITVEMDNAAFEKRPATELARILRRLAKRIEQDGEDDCVLMDINGNSVGRFKVSA